MSPAERIALRVELARLLGWTDVRASAAGQVTGIDPHGDAGTVLNPWAIGGGEELRALLLDRDVASVVQHYSDGDTTVSVSSGGGVFISCHRVSMLEEPDARQRERTATARAAHHTLRMLADTAPDEEVDP